MMFFYYIHHLKTSHKAVYLLQNPEMEMSLKPIFLFRNLCKHHFWFVWQFDQNATSLASLLPPVIHERKAKQPYLDFVVLVLYFTAQHRRIECSSQSRSIRQTFECESRWLNSKEPAFLLLLRCLDLNTVCCFVQLNQV